MNRLVFIVPLMFALVLVQQGNAYNIGVVTIPLYQMLVKDLPQNELETSGEYVGLAAYYGKLKLSDVWEANSGLALEIILNDKVTTIITDGRTLFERGLLSVATLPGYNCTSSCFNVSVPLILSATGWSEARLDGKVEPIVRIRDIHYATIKAVEERFCCNMTTIANQLGLANGVRSIVFDIDIWGMFIPHIGVATIKCKADLLKVTTAELAELLRTNLPTLTSYDLNQLESNFFPAYEDLIRRKNLFETQSIITGVLVTAPSTQWQSGTMSEFANIVSQFTVRDLEILYRWRDPQLFAIQNIPMSIFQSGCGTISLFDPLFKLSEALFGFPSNLPSCDIAYLLSRSLNEVESKFIVTSIDNQNVLDIFRNESRIYSWFDVYKLLQLNIDEGIWIETPRISQVAIYSAQTPSAKSIPQIVSYIRNFNQSSILNTIMASNYPSFLAKLLVTYGYSAAQLALSGAITQSQLNLLTIQQAHSLILHSIMARYDITGQLVSAVGIPGVDFHVLINLPSSMWDTTIRAAIQAAFNQSANAYSVKLSEGGVQITTINGGFTSIQVSDSPVYHTKRVTPSELANCLSRSLTSIYSLSFTGYHQLFISSIVPILQNKHNFETQSMEALLLASGLQFDDIESKSVTDVITQLTGLTKENLGCFYPWSSIFLNTDLAKTFANANTTRLCNDFLGLSLYNIVLKINQTPDKLCFLCTINPCSPGAICKDVPNSFTCTCKQGYTGNGIGSSGCIDIPECQLGLHTCHVNATCIDTSGNYQCTCNTGFAGNGQICQDIFECVIDPNRCGLNGICVETIGSFYCRCGTGYRWNGATCIDIDECGINTDNCHQYANCVNNIGSFTCVCRNGFFGNGVICQDVAECNFQAGLYPCHAQADCTEIPGSYICQCKPGYVGDGKNCADIDECAINTDNCHINALCINTVPQFYCQCKTGFSGNGVLCADIDECGTGLHNCHRDANCINSQGSFTCLCKNGFNGNGTYCYVAQVSFVQNSYSVVEGGQVDITVSLSGTIDSIALVNIIIGGTATGTNNEDYTLSSQTLLFQVNGPKTQNLIINTIDDTKLEPTETIILSLSSLHNHVVAGGITTTTVSIADNDVVTISLSQRTYTVSEANAFVNVVVQIVSGIIDRDIVVSLNTTPLTAVANIDYTTSFATLRFSPSESVKVVKIAIRDDSFVESNEEFSVSLTTSDVDVNLLTRVATVVIQDDDVATVKFEKSTDSVGEENNININVLLVGTLAVPVTARLSSSNGGAESGKDYNSLLDYDITFNPNGPTSQLVNIQILEDNIVENNEIFVVSLSSRSSPSLIVVTPTTTSITIVDNDVLSVSFVPFTYIVEEETRIVKVNVVVTGSFEKRLDLSTSTVDNTAKSGDGDYQSFIGSPLIFNVGDPNQKEISVSVLEDSIIETTESFYVNIASIDPKIVFPNGRRATITILNDDLATVYIPNPTYVYNENAASSSIPVSLTGSLATPVTVRLSTMHDTAVWPQDYSLISNYEMVFQPGQQTKQLQLDIEDDAIVEATETFYVVLTTLDSRVRIGQWNKTKIQILDNDKLRVRFSSSQYSAVEESRYAIVGLVLLDVLQTDKIVRLIPSDGTATEPEDFPLRTYDVTLSPGQPRTVYVNITIINDIREESSEHFFLSLFQVSSNVEIVNPAIANITIAESDDINFCDPHARQYPCNIKADCVDVPSSYVCTCSTGYQGDGLICADIDECTTINCPFNGRCINTPGSYRCVCQVGFFGNGVVCNDIDECTTNTHDCDVNAVCSNTIGSFNCSCTIGYEGTGKICTDINECDRNLDNCHTNAICTNNGGSYECTCKNGYRGNGVTCEDIEECAENRDNCHSQATCANTQGSFTCVCKFGFSGDGVICQDNNECSIPSHNCHVNASCSNTPGSFLCNCLSGFDGNGRNCADIDECTRNIDNCPANSICINTIGAFICQCNPGFSYNGFACIDINECQNGNNNCHLNADCINEPGTFRCVCKWGYTGSGTTCSNLNECLLNPNPCHQYGSCQDTDGSFVCTCNSGFTGNGTYCEDIFDCIELPRQYPCDVRATCTDIPGSFTCTCPSGFSISLNQKICTDIDECLGVFSCHANATCVNTDGSYKCQCIESFVGDGKISCIDTTCRSTNPCSPDAACSVNVTTSSYDCVCNSGFTGNGRVCTEIDECLIPGSCGLNTNCLNQPRGSYTCFCKPGFSGNPIGNCIDIDECLRGPCGAQARCVNSPGTFICECNQGYSGDGFTCQDINECLVSSTCDQYAICSNTPVGSYTCTCKSGFTGSGRTCSDIDECNQASSCPANADCKNTIGAFNCICKSGYVRDGANVCIDIDECQTQVCDIGANCKNIPGSYQCVCPENLFNNGNFCHVYCSFKLDLTFIVDTSQSIETEDFNRVIQFLTESVAQMEIGVNGNHIAAIAFGNTAEVFMYFNTITGPSLTRATVIDRLKNFPHLRGLTRIDLALLKAESDVFTVATGMRDSANVRKVAVVLTDGKQTIGPGVPIEPLVDIARKLQAKDITVLAIGVGDQVSKGQLLNITNGNEKNVLEVNSFEALQSVIFSFINISCTDIDECNLYNPCHVNANCKDTLGAFFCSCKIGYAGDGYQCIDIDECTPGNNNCHTNANCNNIPGSYSCACKSGYAGDGRICTDIDECTPGNNICNINANCTNTPGSYSCVCKSGFTGDGRTCTDIDECTPAGNNNCDSNANCNNIPGTYSCACKSGFSGDGTTCTNIDECATGDNNCDPSANCIDVQGTYSCVCKSGFTGDGRTCTIVIVTCGGKTCHSNAACVSNVCICNAGYTGDGTNCADIDECTSGNNNCNPNANCDNTPGSYSCACKSGYTGDGRTCTDIDECTSGNNICNINANCNNIPGSYSCACKSGYTGDGRTCTVTCGGKTCHSNAACVSNICVCNAGYTGDGTSCAAIPCAGKICHPFAECVSNNCFCKSGFTGDGINCIDMDECFNDELNECSSNAYCNNTHGSYICTCKSGFNGNGKACINFNECTTTGICDSNAICIDAPGTYSCICKNGYTGGGTTCTDINECTSGNNNCNSNANCENTPGTYRCDCKSGYTGDGRTCTATCVGKTCHSSAYCDINTNNCVCNNGFSGDGTSCIDKDECSDVPANCGNSQTCRNYPGTYECYCTSPGRFLDNGTCLLVSTVQVQMEILNRIFLDEMSKVNSLEFLVFSQRLKEKLDAFFLAIYQTYLGSTILNLSDGSVVVRYLIHYTPPLQLTTATVRDDFIKALNHTNNLSFLDTYQIEESKLLFQDYDECDPSSIVHTKDCPANSYCVNKEGTYGCECLIGYNKKSDSEACISEDKDWWIVYAVIFGALLFVVLFLIILFFSLEFSRNKERYALHDEERKDGRVDKRVEEEVAPGFPGTIPRSNSGTGSQILLKNDSVRGSERLGMYEVNPIYDSTNDKVL